MSLHESATPELDYKQYLWGDYVRGARSQLVALGIGVGQPYPGDRGAKKWSTRVHDPRGFDVELHREYDGTFSAHVHFPGWPDMPARHGTPAEFCPGVTRRAGGFVHDEFVGTRESLIAAGLVEPGQFPGDPGMRNSRVIIYPSGEVPGGFMAATEPQAKAPGAKRIKRQSARLYRVDVNVSMEESERRFSAYRQAEDEWRETVRKLPRPAPLLALPELTRQFGRPAEFVPDRSATVVRLADWRASRGQE